MSTHLSDIGFQVQTESDFVLLAKEAYIRGKKIKTNKGGYINWSLRCGAELWAQADEEGELIGLNPYFNGKSQRVVMITSLVKRNENTLDGAFYGWANPSSNKADSGDYPFVFDVPDYFTLPKFKYPKKATIQLSAFAHRISCFDNEEEYYQSEESELKGGRKNEKKIHFAPESFIPSGLFLPGGKIVEPEQAEAIFTGKVLEFEKKMNEFSNREFIWILVKTLGGEVDVVGDSELLNKEPIKNGIITGFFWLSGRIINK